MNKKNQSDFLNQKALNIKSRIQFLFSFFTLIILSSNIYAALDMRDYSFGTRGISTTPFTERADRAHAVVIQPDGKIVTGGTTTLPAGSSSHTDFALIRYNADGTLDPSFGSGGKVITSFGFINPQFFSYNSGVIYGLALQPDGKIIAAGNSADGITLVRYHSNGSVDASFGINGKVTTKFDNYTSAYGSVIALQPNGKVVVTSWVFGNSTGSQTAVVRYNNDGSLDSTFGSGGKVLTVSYGTVCSLVIQSDEKIIIGGSRSNGANSDFALLRLSSDGTLDSTFGVNGMVTTSFESRNDGIYSIALQSDGKIVAGGTSSINSNNTNIYHPALARYNADGSLDSTFGTNGKILETNWYSSNLLAVKIQADGKIVTAGGTSGNSELIRYHANGTLDESFGILGKEFPRRRDDSSVQAFAIQPDGQIITAGFRDMGFSNGAERNTDFMVARFRAGQGKSIAKYDFDGDGKSDISLFRPSDGVWYLNQSSAGFNGTQFGAAGDKPVAADYDGDGRTDIAVYRNGTWYLMKSQEGFTAAQFGDANDIPIPADYNDDGKAELMVYRPSNGYWYILNLVNNELTAKQLGEPGDKPVVLDYSVDGRADIGVYRNGKWILWVSEAARNIRYLAEAEYGAAGDIPVQDDYNGDGRVDLAVFRPSSGIWYFRSPNAGGYSQMSFGLGSDLPVPADYDGDGKTDVSVFRNGIWYMNRSRQGLMGSAFGLATDKPAPNVNVH